MSDIQARIHPHRPIMNGLPTPQLSGDDNNVQVNGASSIPVFIEAVTHALSNSLTGDEMSGLNLAIKWFFFFGPPPHM